jgi:ABC-2 type transport system ATP-binding protein
LTDTILEVRGLVRSFGKVRAVDDVSFTVGRGQIFGFIGPNGAGKTTTMRVLATLDLPDAGDAFVDGHSVLVEPRRARERIGFMPDKFEPYQNLSVTQYLDFFARAYGLRGRTRLSRIRAVSSFCSLDEFADRPSTGLSKGMGQRLHLAKTMLHDPALLVLDEPANGLDPRARIEFRALLAELAATGKSVLISSHILAELSETCHGVVVIERGRLVVTGAISDIAKQVKEQDERILVRVLGDTAAAERFFAAQPFVREVIPVDGRLELVFQGGDDQAADMLARAIGAGLRIVEYVARDVDLEEIFMRATQGRLQ